MTKLIRGRREVGKRVGSTASHWLMLMLPVMGERGEGGRGEGREEREGERGKGGGERGRAEREGERGEGGRERRGREREGERGRGREYIGLGGRE